MYVSIQELAYWGYLHLSLGSISEHQIVPKEVIRLATTIHSPPSIQVDDPQNGCLWFVQGHPARRTEIGEHVPLGSYQILGATNVALLVIPELKVVAVYMHNRLFSPDGYDYLSQIRAFGNCVTQCAK